MSQGRYTTNILALLSLMLALAVVLAACAGETSAPDSAEQAADTSAQEEAAAEEEVAEEEMADEEMAEEDITLDEVLEAVATGTILENYPEHRRGACCLVGGFTQNGRPLHIVCTTTQEVLIIIIVYEPRPPKWLTPTQRRQK